MSNKKGSIKRKHIHGQIMILECPTCGGNTKHLVFKFSGRTRSGENATATCMICETKTDRLVGYTGN